ncbi:MAG: radical SAM protein [Candidatus Aenigmatarchaeota archaeon]
MRKIRFDYEEQHFILESEEFVIPEYPLTMTSQITRRCNLNCIYCSESGFIPDPSQEELKRMVNNLKGVERVIVSGGEPTLRRDLFSILEIYKNNFNVVAMSTNATSIDLETAKRLSKYVNYVDVTIDGPRHIHNRIRGSYDKVMYGLWNLKQAGVEFSIVMVLLEENIDYVSHVAQISDVLGAKKLKILTPIPKGRGKTIVSKKPSSLKIKEVFDYLKQQKDKVGWNTRITLTDWENIGEGHALLIHPNGDVVASPVWSKESCIDYVGNILEENIKDIWAKYPYKENHVKKYIEKTLMVC